MSCLTNKWFFYAALISVILVLVILGGTLIAQSQGEIDIDIKDKIGAEEWLEFYENFQTECEGTFDTKLYPWHEFDFDLDGDIDMEKLEARDPELHAKLEQATKWTVEPSTVTEQTRVEQPGALLNDYSVATFEGVDSLDGVNIKFNRHMGGVHDDIKGLAEKFGEDKDDFLKEHKVKDEHSVRGKLSKLGTRVAGGALGLGAVAAIGREYYMKNKKYSGRSASRATFICLFTLVIIAAILIGASGLGKDLLAFSLISAGAISIFGLAMTFGPAYSVPDLPSESSRAEIPDATSTAEVLTQSPDDHHPEVKRRLLKEIQSAML